VRGTVRKPRTAGGAWSYRLDLDVDSSGKRAQKQVGGFASKKDAQAALNEALTGVQRGTYIAPSRQTLAEFLKIWVEGVRTEVQITAWISYKSMVEQYVIPHLGSKRLVELSPMHIKPWHALLLDHGGQRRPTAVVAHRAAVPPRVAPRDGRRRPMEPHLVQPTHRRARSPSEHA
jgi:hypothetical protein